MTTSATSSATTASAVEAAPIRHDWSTDEIATILGSPLLELVHRAGLVHHAHNRPNTVQLATLLSIKTGGCPEDCGYCPQSAHYDAPVEKQPLMLVDEVLTAARRAREVGASRFCMGAAWREVKDGPEFDAVLEMVRGVHGLGLEACVTLGMLSDAQAKRLADAGLTAYNHNLDTSPEYYGEIITTRTYEDRLRTLDHVREAGITICCGGIIGLGESTRDRARMLETLANMNPHPESVPINGLVRVEGTPLEGEKPFDPLDLVRMIATARILMPKSQVRLSAGRTSLTREAQVLCFLAGANSIFYGEKLLTTANPETDADLELLRAIGVETVAAPPPAAEPAIKFKSARAASLPVAPSQAAPRA
ncbi:MAG: biotin synthase BioB [Deltaproteobacteria bacterium]|nr:biotin synthase BioB [Deltaproteobacteria bacterium]